MLCSRILFFLTDLFRKKSAFLIGAHPYGDGRETGRFKPHGPAPMGKILVPGDIVMLALRAIDHNIRPTSLCCMRTSVTKTDKPCKQKSPICPGRLTISRKRISLGAKHRLRKAHIFPIPVDLIGKLWQVSAIFSDRASNEITTGRDVWLLRIKLHGIPKRLTGKAY